MYCRLSRNSIRKVSCSNTSSATDVERPATQERGFGRTGQRKESLDLSGSNIYISYEDLPNFYKEAATDFFAIFRDLEEQSKNNDDWKVHFDIVESLRILNKYYPSELVYQLDSFANFLLSCIDNLRTNLSKNGLLLFKELMEHFREIRPSENFLDTVFPRVIDKSMSDKAFIKTEARAALKTLEKTGCNDTVVGILCKRTFDKNANISELSFETLAEIIKETKENLEVKLNSEYLELVFQTIGAVINGKRAVSKRVAEDLCQQIKGSLPSNDQELETYLRDKMKVKDLDANGIIKAMQTKKVKNSKPDFSSFLKDKKLKKNDGKDDFLKEDGKQINHIQQNGLVLDDEI